MLPGTRSGADEEEGKRMAWVTRASSCTGTPGMHRAVGFHLCRGKSVAAESSEQKVPWFLLLLP